MAFGCVSYNSRKMKHDDKLIIVVALEAHVMKKQVWRGGYLIAPSFLQ
jgi:hypothetical protein